MRVTFLGLGKMGCALVPRLLNAGHTVTVWNRNTVIAEKFAVQGAEVARSAADADEKDRLSRAIHAASIVARFPEDDLFQRFHSLGPSDFRVDLYYPVLPKPRTDQILMIEVLISSGTDTDRNKDLVAALVEKLGEAGIDPNDIMVFFLETDRANGSFGGGRFAPPIALPRAMNTNPYCGCSSHQRRNGPRPR